MILFVFAESNPKNTAVSVMWLDLVILAALLYSSESTAVDLQRTTVAVRRQELSTVRATSQNEIKESDNKTDTQEGVERCVHGLFRADLEASLHGVLFFCQRYSHLHNKILHSAPASNER